MKQNKTQPLFFRPIIRSKKTDSQKDSIFQNLANLPTEILSQPRFFRLIGNDKGDTPKGWSNPQNQSLYSAIQAGCLAGFDTCGHERAADYCLCDFDHVLDDNGNFVNADAEKWYNLLAGYESYCEKSISSKGLHFLFRPSADKFRAISGGKRGTLYFGGDAKLELFYQSAARYCLLTGDVYQCEPQTPIVAGNLADDALQKILAEIERRNPAPKQPARQSTDNPPSDSAEYDLFRAQIMLDCIKPAELADSDWLAVISAAKNIGIDYHVVDAWNKRDPDSYNETENQKRWDSLTDSSFGIETLHGKAKDFGYAEKDTRREWHKLCKAHDKAIRKQTAAAKFANHTDAEATNETNTDDDFNGYDFLKLGDNSDLPNARRLEKFRGRYFRWLSDDETWLTYDKGIWLRRSEKNSVLYPVAAEFGDKMFDFAKQCAAYFSTLEPPRIIAARESDKSLAQKIYDKAESDMDKAFKICGYFERRKNYSSAIDLLKSCNSILITAADLNAHRNLLCCADCVVDLQTGKVYDFAPEYLISNRTNAAYQKYISDEADAFVRKVLADIIPDEPTRRSVLRYLGYGLTGERNYQISQFWRGSGANGKSTILDTLKEILGSYIVKLPCAALLASSKPADGNAATPSLALLDGDKRLAIVDELPQKSRLDAALYKTLVTDKTVTGRQLHQNFRDIQLRCKLILNGNYLPIFNANDKATRRRINTVEFTESFEGDRADKNLLNKLANPYAQCAFLQILVAEAIEFYRDGLLESDAMKQAKAEYISESDVFSQFVLDNCEVGDGFILRKDFETRLKAEYPAETSTFPKKQLLKAICESLKPLGVEYTKGRHNINIFKGIRWQQAEDFDGEVISSADYATP